MIKKLPLFVWICNLTRSVQLQQAGNALADGLQAEVLCLDLFPRQPQHFARIVHRRCTLRIGNSAEEEHVDGMVPTPASAGMMDITNVLSFVAFVTLISSSLLGLSISKK